MDEKKITKNIRMKFIVTVLITFLLSILGLTYAYFSIQVTGNEEASSLKVTTARISLIYTDVQIVMGEYEQPGWTQTKTLTVENDGTDTVAYTIIWRDLYNELTDGELVISATCSASSGTCAAINETIVPTRIPEGHNISVKKNISIAPGVTHTYTLTALFKETGSNQNYNQNKEFYGTLNIAEGADEHPLYKVMRTLATAGTYATTYSGTSNDTYGETGTKTIYYVKPATTDDVSTLLNKINVKFAGYCWQILRTTDTGGIKLIYNGDPDANGHCKAMDITDTHKGVIANSNGAAVAMSGDYQYADSYTYNLTAGTFTLVNPSQDNYANNKNLIGKYTCMTSSSTTTCSTLYFLNTPNRATVNSPFTVTYTIGDTQNAQIGTTPFNANYRSPAYVGYKYGQAYDWVANSAPTSGSIMGNDVYWNGTNYELRESNNSVSTGTTKDDNHHYTCNSTSATCTNGKVRFYYYGNYYIELLNGDDIDTALTRMLEENKYDSAMKSYLENWFRNKMLAYKDYLDENTVYCNDRSITQIGGWTNTGGIGTGSTNYLTFNSYSTITDLSCTKNTDKFSVGNMNAQLNYPVGLATAPEMNIITNATLRNTGQNFRLVSPRYFNNTSGGASERGVDSSGGMGAYRVDLTSGARPVVSLAPSNIPVSGTGAYDNPYVIGE